MGNEDQCISDAMGCDLCSLLTRLGFFQLCLINGAGGIYGIVLPWSNPTVWTWYTHLLVVLFFVTLDGK